MRRHDFRSVPLLAPHDRVDRVLGLFSSRRIGTPPPPKPQASVSPPPLVPVGSALACGRGGRGWGIPIPTKGPDTVVGKDVLCAPPSFQA
jgi:hypothetical protein